MVTSNSNLICLQKVPSILTICRQLGLIILLAINLSANAADTLTASVDRDKVYLNESFNLKLTGNAEVDFSFGGLLNFGRNQIEAPTLEGIEENFEILDRQQNYSMRSINGSTTTEVTWNYTLTPKRTGKLTIPAAAFKNARSQAILIEVLPGKAPINEANPPSVFIEVEVDKQAVYVQEQVKFSIRLYSLGRLSSGNLSEPSHSDAIIEPFGDEKKYYRMVYNQRYEVIERNYLIFPQKSGAIELPGINFNGTLIDSVKRRRLRVSEVSDSTSLDVSPPNSRFIGEHWIPAKSLHISENWQKEVEALEIGDAITREITVSALGLLGSALPPIPQLNSESVKTYPDKPGVESNIHEAGAQGSRKESTTYIAVSEGLITLPEVRIDWWDTVNDVARVATLPSRTIRITANNKIEQASSNLKAKEPAGSLNPIQTASTDTLNDIEESDKRSAPALHGLYSIIVLLTIGWVATSLYLLQKLRIRNHDLQKLTMQGIHPLTSSSHDLKDVIASIRSESPDMPKLVLSWISHSSESERQTVKTINQLSGIDKEIAGMLELFEQKQYGRDKSSEFDQERLITLLKKYQDPKQEEKTSRRTELQPFYPQ